MKENKIQWQVIVGIILALIIAIFAVVNVDPVEVNFLFLQADWPLILIILGSVLCGCLIIFFLNISKSRNMKKKLKQLTAEKSELERQLAAAKAMKTHSSQVETRKPENTDSVTK
ncbi:LapA family protein [Listeria ivanovii]|uniref:Lipopolysaccharide assembly protein A domain-containing protein n=1 Tax=Listeria ivanovii (strain ATCC BAA-678 / PAM 55) TaxID=881621 RepID=G2Z9M5_LISIP|nr:lipopolysaccharide assembly protein LapA domain-containing protein [Listeria ivanovii]AHI56022.1 hypothetical protein AX25_07915 [Listeria ivanovii WSLC3009]AIS65461.1 hypothetical protein JL52_07770 [Listeria ivanovii subsp. ivanovii]MBC1759373.1 DUF1049 domain-containing protein [Listeria ivanovii]MBK3914376.1 DUF1049 domain-containing protein [Listeria ivanovii subsp. ivanovii]MBK3921725.1 DUF1049 domain-containing protein [Listeria ivanovii subsp. ivanovii]